MPSQLKQKDNLAASKISHKCEDNGNVLSVSAECPAAEEPLTASTKELTVEMAPPLPDAEITLQVKAPPEQSTVSSSQACSVSGECSSCETKLVKLEQMKAEVLRLRGLLESKDVQLKKSRHRLEAVINQNTKLKAAASGVRHGMNSLANIIKSSVIFSTYYYIFKHP